MGWNDGESEMEVENSAVKFRYTLDCSNSFRRFFNAQLKPTSKDANANATFSRLLLPSVSVYKIWGFRIVLGVSQSGRKRDRTRTVKTALT